MRIGLLYVDDFKQIRSQRIGSLGLAYISAYIERAFPGIEIEIALTPQELLKFEADLVGISAYTETLPIAREYAKEIREKRDIPLVLGGAHIATNPDDLPPEFDFGVAGEGEDVFLHLVRGLQANALHQSYFQGVSGLSYRQNGMVISQGRCPDIQNLDQLAHPKRRDMFRSMERHFASFEPVLHIHTARGCPYRCTFCSAPLVNPSWRFHSPEWVVQDLLSIARDFPQCREITISDDLFTLKKSRLAALVKAIRHEGLHRRFAFFCSSRSNTLTHEMCQLLRDMNIRMVSFGLESASDRVIRDLKGVGASEADYSRVLGLCEHYGIMAHGNFILGAQDESLQDLQQTWAFVNREKDRFSSVYFSHMTPFPGTKVWEDGLKAKRFNPETLDYRVLNLEYEPGRSVFLNTHYQEIDYQQAYPRFKAFESWLNTRYYGDQSLISDMQDQERQVIPEALFTFLKHQLYFKNILVCEREIWLPEDGSLEIIRLTKQEYLESTTLPEHDAVVLCYSLEEMKDPTILFQRFNSKPVISLNYHMGVCTLLAQLLIGTWSENTYGAVQRRHLRHYTLKTLQSLFATHHYHLHAFRPNRYTLPLKIDQLQSLFGELLFEPLMFSFVTCWTVNSNLKRD